MLGLADSQEPLLAQNKENSQWGKISLALLLLLLLSALVINGFSVSREEVSIGEVPVSFNPAKWRDVGTPTGLGDAPEAFGYTKSIKFSKADLTSLGGDNPSLNPGARFNPTNLFGADDEPLQATYIVPYQSSKALHLDFPKACNDGEIVATAAAITSCSLVVGTSPLDANLWRAYHDFGYVVDFAGGNFRKLGDATKGYINFPAQRPATQGLAGGPWHYRPVKPDTNNDLANDQYVVVNRDLSWVYYDHYNWQVTVGMDFLQTWFWGLKCNGGAWQRIVYHFTYPIPSNK